MLDKTTIPGIYRSTESGALINKDNSSLAAYKKKRNAAKQAKLMYEQIEILQKTVNDLLIRIEALEKQ